MYIRENPIRIGIGRHASRTRRRAINRTPKNAVEAPTCPDGNEWYLVLKCGPPQRMSVCTDGRGRGTTHLITVPVTPASASAISIARKTRDHFLLPRIQAIAKRINPTRACDHQSPNLLTFRMKLYKPRF